MNIVHWPAQASIEQGQADAPGLRCPGGFRSMEGLDANPTHFAG